MKRRLYAPLVLLIGLMSAQVVATAHVYLSNLHLMRTTEAVMRAGYLAVPNARVAAHLDALTTAMAGGLFFTLSIGAGLSLSTLIAAWLWVRPWRGKPRVTVVYLLAWIAGIILVNGNGWNSAATAYLIVVPSMTAIAAIRLLPAPTPLIAVRGILWPVSAAILLTLLWGLVLDRHLFTNIRDHLLLGSRVGQSVATAYYTYTLFPAEAFKSLAQKQIRTCSLESNLERTNRRRLEQVLRTHDYLPIASGSPADLTLARDRKAAHVVLKHGRRTVMRIAETALLSQPDKVLAEFARRLDRNRPLRLLALAGLTVGFPLILYTYVFSLLGLLPSLFLTAAVTDMTTAAFCVGVGITLLVPVYRGHAALADRSPTLTAPTAPTRIAALKQAYQKRRDIVEAARELSLSASPHIAERYWLARSLAYAKNPGAQAMLATLADDAVPIVACQALWSMGERRNRAAIPTIVDRINASSHWYVQMYGYRALRRMGWVQPRSPRVSY